jgi:hypothetical protein
MVTMLSEQSARKGSIEQRALAVITTSGALVSLLVALSALLGSNAKLHLRAGPRATLVAAVVFFVVAAILALVTNSPRAYLEFGPKDLDRMLAEWNSGGEDARWLVSQAHASLIKRATKLNDNKALLLQIAVGVEVAAVSLVALSVALTLM